MKYLVSILAILSLTALTYTAIQTGIDGAGYLSSIALIAGLGGYAVAKKSDTKPKE